jgi:hypothetical protein
MPIVSNPTEAHRQTLPPVRNFQPKHGLYFSLVQKAEQRPQRRCGEILRFDGANATRQVLHLKNRLGKTIQPELNQYAVRSRNVTTFRAAERTLIINYLCPIGRLISFTNHCYHFGKSKSLNFKTHSQLMVDNAKS